MTTHETLPVTIDDVRAAAQRVVGRVHRTPGLISRTLDAATGARVFCKAENLQRTGAFKIRGAFNAIASLPAQEPEHGVVAYSSGNHAQAVALAARELGVPATVLMPKDAPSLKREATAGYGARVIEFDRCTESREQLAHEIAERTGASIIPPFDHPAVMAGQGTAALELLEQVPDLDALVVPIGGGGLASGCAVAARALRPSIRVIGVEPAAGDDARQSLAAGRIVQIDVPHTVADGAQTTALGQHTFPVLRRELEQIVTVTDDELLHACRFLLERMKTLVEPTGALAAAAVLTGAADVAGQRVGVILSGGNTELARLAALHRLKEKNAL